MHKTSKNMMKMILLTLLKSCYHTRIMIVITAFEFEMKRNEKPPVEVHGKSQYTRLSDEVLTTSYQIH